MSKDYRDKHPVCLVKPGEKEHFQFWCDGEWVTYFPDRTAFFLHLQGIPWSTDEPLPEGVFRASDGRLLATCEVARRLAESDDWTAHNTSGVGGPLNAATIAWTSTIVEVRPPSAPKTELVPWWEALRDKRRFYGNDSGNGQQIVGCLRATNGWTLTSPNGYQRFVNDSSDGMVEVLPNEDDQ